jgi:uncharacterized protein YbgA (DUF1722 family)/uncharacterized protein YbbK (DUF523 family)
METKLRLGVSACLLGEPVRFDGGHKRDPFLVRALAPFVEWVPFCPELAAGMGLPREPVRLVRGPDEARRLRTTRSGVDWTDRMNAAADKRVNQLEGLDGYILKSKSPSCGMERVKLYPAEDGAPTKDGVGLFAAALMRRWPNLPVEEEGRLSDPRLREAFIERVFVYQRLRTLWARSWRLGDLVAFHTAHKMALLAHDPEGYRRLGRLVAGGKALPREELRTRYEGALMAILARPTSPGRQANVLMHLLGHLKQRIERADARELVAAIDDHRRGLVPLVVPITLLRHHVRRAGVPYVEGQTYLEPHPRDLMLRNHV